MLVSVLMPYTPLIGDLAQKCADQCCLPGAVLADEHSQLTTVNMHVHVMQDFLSASGYRYMAQVNPAEPACITIQHGILLLLCLLFAGHIQMTCLYMHIHLRVWNFNSGLVQCQLDRFRQFIVQRPVVCILRPDADDKIQTAVSTG